MIKIAFYRQTHHLFVTTAPQPSIATLAEIGKVAHQEHAHGVCVMKHQRIFDLDVDTQEIETSLFREVDVSLETLHVSRGVNSFRVIGLVQYTAMVPGNIVQ